QERTVAITLLPVAWELTGGARQNRRSQSFHLDPRKNQESADVDDVLQVACALSRVPTDPAITHGHRPCGTGPLQACQDSAAGLDEVPQVGSNWSPVAEIVVALNELAEQAVFRFLHQAQTERFHVGEGGLDWFLGIADSGD